MRTSDYCESVTTPSEDIVRTYRRAVENDDSDCSLMVVSYRGGQAEFDLGRKYAFSPDPLDRVIGADVLSQLGWGDDLFHEESVDLLLPLLTDSDERVVAAAAIALGHRRSPPAIPAILSLVDHPTANIRLAAVSGLSRQDDPSAIKGLIVLARDTDRDVRNWAAFGLGSMTEVDTVEIRDALAPLLEEADPEIRGEALIGLAARHDPRVLPALIRELKGTLHGSWCLEAAELLGDPQLLPLIVLLRATAPIVAAATFAADFDRAVSASTE